MLRRLAAARVRLLAAPSVHASEEFALTTCTAMSPWYAATLYSTRRGTGSGTKLNVPACAPEALVAVPPTLHKPNATVAASKFETVPQPYRVRVQDLVGPNVKLNQVLRMPMFDEEVEIYPSPGRQELWSSLDQQLQALAGTGTAVAIGVSGISGCGKSHALLWWAKEQMDRGHLVMYVQDAECFGYRTWGIDMHNTLHHAAMKLWKHWDGLLPEADRRPVEILEKRWTDLNKAIIPSLVRKDPVDFQITHLDSMLSSAPRAPDFYSEFLRELIAQVIAVANPSPGSIIRSVLIVDQDNKLQKAKSNDIGAALAADKFVSQSPCAVTVICASANNEGWERRVLRHMIQVYPEPVRLEYVGLPHLLPLNVLCKILKLKPGSVTTAAEAKALVPAFFKRLEQLTKFYPLELRLFSQLCENQASEGAGWESLLAQYEEERGAEIRREMREFIEGVSSRRIAMWNVLKGHYSVTAPVLDRRYISASRESKLQKFVTPIAWGAAWEVLEEAYGALNWSAIGEAERGKVYEGKLITLCQKRDLLRLDRKNRRRPDFCRNPAVIFRRAPDPKVVYVVPPTHDSQRGYDFTLITGTWGPNSKGIAEPRFCVIFVQCCSGSQHKDSFRDLVLTGDTYWQEMLPPERCYLGYLWITPTEQEEVSSKVGVKKVKNVFLRLDFNEVAFCELSKHVWKSVISRRDLFQGRTAELITNDHSWKQFLAFDEMHITVLYDSLV